MVEVDMPSDALTQQQNLKSGDDSDFLECMQFYIPCMLFSSSGGAKDYVTLECGDGSDDEAEETSHSAPENDNLLQHGSDKYEQFGPALEADEKENQNKNTHQSVTKELLEGLKAIDAQSDETSETSTVVSDVPPPPPPYDGLELEDQPSDEHIDLPMNLVQPTSNMSPAVLSAVVEKSVSESSSNGTKENARPLLEGYSKDQFEEDDNTEEEQKSEASSTVSPKPDAAAEVAVLEESDDDDDDDSEDTGPLPVAARTPRSNSGDLPVIITVETSSVDERQDSDDDSLPDNDIPALSNPKDDHRDDVMEEDDDMEPGRIRVGRPKEAPSKVEDRADSFHRPNEQDHAKPLEQEDDEDCLGQLISSTTGGLYEDSLVKLQLDEDFEQEAGDISADLLSDDGGENF